MTIYIKKLFRVFISEEYKILSKDVLLRERYKLYKTEANIRVIFFLAIMLAVVMSIATLAFFGMDVHTKLYSMKNLYRRNMIIIELTLIAISITYLIIYFFVKRVFKITSIRFYRILSSICLILGYMTMVLYRSTFSRF